jgi:hypothetical protein
MSFSNRIFIIDEAHNLRDNPDEKEEKPAMMRMSTRRQKPVQENG